MNFTSFLVPSSLLSLSSIRSVLIRLEDTIIFSLIERAQFAANARIYECGAFREDLKGWEGSWLDWFLKETESFHAKARRYQSPDEYPFTPLSELPAPVLPALSYPPLLHGASITNVNDKILAFYIHDIVPAITAQNAAAGADDGNYGSAATRDVEALQAISRRIHYGMFVSESKFLESPSSFIPHILSPNPTALEDLITKPAVEAALLVRLEKKARLYGQDFEAAAAPSCAPNGKEKVDAETVVRMYRDYVIPLTKVVEVEYLLKRLDGLSEAEIEELQRRG